MLKHAPLGEINLPFVATDANAPRRCTTLFDIDVTSALLASCSEKDIVANVAILEELEVAMHRSTTIRAMAISIPNIWERWCVEIQSRCHQASNIDAMR